MNLHIVDGKRLRDEIADRRIVVDNFVASAKEQIATILSSCRAFIVQRAPLWTGACLCRTLDGRSGGRIATGATPSSATRPVEAQPLPIEINHIWGQALPVVVAFLISGIPLTLGWAMIANILAMPLAISFALSLFLLLFGALLGCWLGARATIRGSTTTATIAGAITGMLALIMGFTFSMALSRYDARRDAVLQEANAIGTTALRARLLPAPFAADCLMLLREYMQIRLNLADHIPSSEEMDAALVQSNRIQEKLWQELSGLMVENNAMVPTGLYINSLNEMIDDQEKRLTAFRNQVPVIVILGVYGISLIAVTFVGYAVGLEKRSFRLQVCVLSLVNALVLLLIMDLNEPSTGYMRVSQQPLLDAVASVDGYISASLSKR
jgi:hypothetical protein